MAPRIFYFGPCMKPFKSCSDEGLLVSDSGLKLLSTSEQKTDVKSSSSQNNRKTRVSDMRHKLSQLQEELKNEKEEKFQALQELSESKKKVDSEIHAGQNNSNMVEALQKELQKAKQSEKKILEELNSQTKSLEETKMNLEEAKLEIKSLKENSKSLWNAKISDGWSSRNLVKFLQHTGLSGVLHGEEDTIFRNELSSSIKQDETSKTALDNLAVALKEVTTEANQLKERLSATQFELDRIRSEAGLSKSSLKNTQDELQAASQGNEKLKLEIDESTAAWRHKEIALIECIKMSEEEMNKSKAENNILVKSQKLIREENAKLREMLKHAVGDASVVKENLEISRKENSRLKSILSEKEDELQRMKQEHEYLKVSEAAATCSLKELKSLLSATSTD